LIEVDPESIGVLELDSELGVVLARFERPHAVFHVRQRAGVEVPANHTACPWPRAEAELREGTPHVVAPHEADARVEIVANHEPLEFTLNSNPFRPRGGPVVP
jgi:hypothetical protein